MNIDYAVSFSVEGDSGKNKATREKARNLKLLSNNFSFYTLDNIMSFGIKNKLFKMMRIFLFEIYYFFYTLINIKNRKPDIIYSRNFFGFGPWLISNIFNITWIKEQHGDNFEEMKLLHGTSKIKLFLYKLLEKYGLFFLKKTDGIIFNNPLLEESFIKKFNINNYTKTISIYNGSNTNDFFPIATEKAKKKLHLNNSYDYFLFIGSISKWHGVDLLLKTMNCFFENYKSTSKKVKLLIVGGKNNDYYHSLKNKYQSDDIIFTGRVPVKKAKYYINASKICFLPVKNNRTSPGSPLKLYDYISCGKPVISQSNTKGYSNIVENYNLGVSCDFYNSQKSANIINDFYKSFNEKKYLINNRKAAEEELNWSNVIENWISFANEISD